MTLYNIQTEQTDQRAGVRFVPCVRTPAVLAIFCHPHINEDEWSGCLDSRSKTTRTRFRVGFRVKNRQQSLQKGCLSISIPSFQGDSQC